jgi:mannose-1-phosphate guanylyltransferase/phosphomannomutase
VGRIDYANDFEQRYGGDYLKHLNVDAIQAGENYSRIAVDYANASAGLVLPTLLGRLNADVVAINAVVQELSLYQTPEQFEQGMERLGAITRTLKSAFGVRLDTGGERIYFVDEGGQQVHGMTALAAMAELALKQHGGGGIVAVPVWAPSIFEDIAAKHGAEIVRTRFNSYALMTAALRSGVVIAGDNQGSFIFPQFQPAADGLFAIAKVMELMATQHRSFTEALRSLPGYAWASTRVPCRWEDKGRVMRILNEQYRSSSTRQVDGVKIELGNGDWALVLPDADRPLIHVIAEANTDAEAHQLVDKYAGLVQGLQ